MAVTYPDTQRMLAYQATENGVVRRFRNPSKYDVLSGRGGSVNSHFGNVFFREIVQARKYEYNLESKKERKAEICREVMAQVIEKGGTFLVKENETAGGFWTEQSDERTMAKVSQALREGAPKMRQAVGISTTSRKRTSQRQGRTTSTDDNEDGPAAAAVLTNRNNNKRVRVEYMGKQVHPGEVTPPLTTSSSPSTSQMPSMTLSSSVRSSEKNANSGLLVPKQLPQVQQQQLQQEQQPLNSKTLQRSASSISLTGITPEGNDNSFFLEGEFVDPFTLILPEIPLDRKPAQRSHSLALPDINANPNYLLDDFVNPFEHEEEDSHYFSFARQTSNASDMGGLGSLLHNEAERGRHPWQQHGNGFEASSIIFTPPPLAH